METEQMKQLCIVALMAMVAVANASTIKWGASGVAKYGETSLTSGAANAYLVYLGENVSDWSKWSYSADFKNTKVDSTTTAKLGTVTASSVIVTAGSPISGLDEIASNFTPGSSSFGIVYTTTQAGKDYYFLGGTFKYDTTSSNYNATQDMYTFTSSTAPKSTDTWTAVPEPSTAALALAGLALLLKRRKA